MTLVPNFRVNVGVPFPATVSGGGPVSISKQNGVWTVNLVPFTQLTALPSGFDPTSKFLLLYDNVAGSFAQTNVSGLITSALGNIPSFGRNIVGRNGGLEVWQRLVGAGTTIALGASTTAYTADGWYLLTNANQASTVTKVAGLVSQSRAAAKVQRNSAQTGVGVMSFAFPLDSDELFKMRGQQVIISFTAQPGANWSPANGTLTYQLEFGTGANPAKRGVTPYPGETIALTGSVNMTAGGAAQRVVSTPSIAIPTNVTQAELTFTWTPVGTAGADDSFSLDDVQVEIGASANINPTFERTDFAWDIERCQRFLPVYNASSASATDLAAGITTTTTTGRYFVSFQVQPRTAPTGVTVSAAAHFNGIDGGGTARAVSALVFANAGPLGATLTATIATGTTGGGTLQSANVSAQLLFTGAEI